MEMIAILKRANKQFGCFQKMCDGRCIRFGINDTNIGVMVVTLFGCVLVLIIRLNFECVWIVDRFVLQVTHMTLGQMRLLCFFNALCQSKCFVLQRTKMSISPERTVKPTTSVKLLWEYCIRYSCVSTSSIQIYTIYNIIHRFVFIRYTNLCFF